MTASKKPGDASVPSADALTPEDIALLQARVAELEAQSASLGAEEGDPGTRRRWTGWRAILATVLIVLATLMTPISIIGSWVRAELVDSDQFVSTFGPLAEHPDVQTLVIDQVTDLIEEQVDIGALTDALFDGIATLDLPADAQNALQLLRGPAAQGAQGLINQTVDQLVRSEAFADVWDGALKISHTALVSAATGGNEGAISIDEQGVVGIEVGPIVEEVRAQLLAQGVSLASMIPAIDHTIVLVQSDALVTVRVVYGMAVGIGWWLPLVTLALFVAGILVARRRSTALLGSGIGFALGAGTLAVGFGVGDTLVGMVASEAGIPSSALSAVYSQVIADMRQTALVLTLLGVVIAILAWSQGRWRAAVATRRALSSTTSALRGFLVSHGVHTGRFGVWMDRNRVLVRIILAVLAVLWLWMLRPLGAGDIFLVLIVTLVVWWLCELVRAEPDVAAVLIVDDPGTEDADAEPDEAIGVIVVESVERKD